MIRLILNRYLIHPLINMQSMRIALFLSLLSLSLCAIPKDIVPFVPGYAEHFQSDIYSGYLNTSSPDRKLHYVFVQSIKKANNSDPLTLWLNGGPGCSSMIGFIQQIGPFFMKEGVHYKKGDNLTLNEYSWHKLSNLLFVESPAGVGFSISNNNTFQYNDHTTAKDNLDALINFFNSYPQYAKNDFWIAGQSYAGKYIPDLLLQIDFYNANTQGVKINLKGILVGNGIMTFQNGDLQRHSIEYMLDHDFIDPQLIYYYKSSCQTDAASAGCRYFKTRYEENIDDINPYNVYSYCYYNDSFVENGANKQHFFDQASILKEFTRKGKFDLQQISEGHNGPTCSFFDGMYQYFNAHGAEFHAPEGLVWNGPCADNVTAKYMISLHGSMEEYRQIIGKQNKYSVILYNGDWDDVVPFTDTIKNLEKLNLKESSVYSAFSAEGQHAGFIEVYEGVIFAIVKGASHMVPQSRRAAAFELFRQTLTSFQSILQSQKQKSTD